MAILLIQYGPCSTSHLDPQEAANTPYYQNRNEKTELESPQSGLFGIGLVDYDIEQISSELKAKGHKEVDTIPMWLSKLSTIQVVKDVLENSIVFIGGVDPRSDGSIGGNDLTTADRSRTETISFKVDDADASAAAAAAVAFMYIVVCVSFLLV